MIELDIPGFKRLRLKHLVLDYNGTLAIDEEPTDGVGERLNDLAAHLASMSLRRIRLEK